MSSIATTNETNNVTSLPSASKAQTAREVIAANVKLLIEQLEAGHSEGLTAYLTAMGRFHSYSFGNILEIARQKPDATRVAGMYAWNQLGRKVMKGQKGIRILAPMIGIRRKKKEEAEKDIRTQNQAVLVGFRSAYVFDVSQTVTFRIIWRSISELFGVVVTVTTHGPTRNLRTFAKIYVMKSTI